MTTDTAKKSQPKEALRRPAAGSRLSPQQLLIELSQAERNRRTAIERGAHSDVVTAFSVRIKALNKQLKRLGVDPCMLR